MVRPGCEWAVSGVRIRRLSAARDSRPSAVRVQGRGGLGAAGVMPGGNQPRVAARQVARRADRAKQPLGTGIPVAAGVVRLLCVCRPGSVAGPGSRRAAGGRPAAAGGAPAASGSRPWCRPHGGRARRRRPACGRWPGRRPAALRTAPAAPRLAGPAPGRTKSPPQQATQTYVRNEAGRRRVARQPSAAAATFMPGRKGKLASSVESPATARCSSRLVRPQRQAEIVELAR
jgi:hypothetical protein